jgi:RimJ/RimL family protein N-acetyltransferase
VCLDSFSTSRIVAERLREDHWLDLCRMDRDHRFMEHLGGARDEAGTRRYLDRNLAHWTQHGFGLWILRRRDTGATLGRAVLRHLQIEAADEVETGYGFLPEFWGQGFATEIANACVRIGREQLKLASMVGITVPANHESQRVLRKVGLEFERNIVHDGVPCMLFRTGYSSE